MLNEMSAVSKARPNTGIRGNEPSLAETNLNEKRTECEIHSSSSYEQDWEMCVHSSGNRLPNRIFHVYSRI